MSAIIGSGLVLMAGCTSSSSQQKKAYAPHIDPAEFTTTVLLPNYKHRGTQGSCDAHRKRYPASRIGESLEENDTSVLFSIY